MLVAVQQQLCSGYVKVSIRFLCNSISDYGYGAVSMIVTIYPNLNLHSIIVNGLEHLPTYQMVPRYLIPFLGKHTLINRKQKQLQFQYFALIFCSL